MENKNEYINKDVKKVDPEHLKSILENLHEKQEEDRRQMARDTAKALSDVFRCGPIK